MYQKVQFCSTHLAPTPSPSAQPVLLTWPKLSPVLLTLMAASYQATAHTTNAKLALCHFAERDTPCQVDAHWCVEHCNASPHKPPLHAIMLQAVANTATHVPWDKCMDNTIEQMQHATALSCGLAEPHVVAGHSSPKSSSKPPHHTPLWQSRQPSSLICIGLACQNMQPVSRAASLCPSAVQAYHCIPSNSLPHLIKPHSYQLWAEAAEAVPAP